MSGILAGLANAATGGIAGLLGQLVQPLIDQIPDPVQRDKAALQASVAAAALDVQMGQMQATVNNTEASSGSMFVAGWRPFVGWVLGASLAWGVVLQPALAFFVTIVGFKSPLPVVNIELTMTLLPVLLGFGALRSFDKNQGVATARLTR